MKKHLFSTLLLLFVVTFLWTPLAYGGNTYTGRFIGNATTASQATNLPSPRYFTNGVTTGNGSINITMTNCVAFDGVPFICVDISNANYFIGQGNPMFTWVNVPGKTGVENDNVVSFDGSYFGGNINPNGHTNWVTGQFNLGVGFGALQDIHSGSRNIAIGAQSGWMIQDGSDNLIIGHLAFQQLALHANMNLVVGNFALPQLASLGTTNNFIIGHYAGFGVEQGQSNMMIGNYAGGNYGPGNETQNILIQSQGVSGENNTMHIGDDGEITNTFIGGNVHAVGTITYWGNLSINSVEAETYTSSSNYIAVTNMTRNSYNGFTGSLTKGTLTNLYAGYYALSFSIIIDDQQTGSPIYSVGIFTNSVLAGTEVKNALDYIVGTPGVETLCSAPQTMYLPTNCAISLRVASPGSSTTTYTTYEISGATLDAVKR